MFRAAILSIVLTLVTGPNAVLFCKLWCVPHEAAATACHHDDATTSPSVTSDHNCGNVVLRIAVVIREGVRRGVSAPGAQHAVLIPCFRLAPSSIDTRLAHEPEQDWLFEQRLQVPALRI